MKILEVVKRLHDECIHHSKHIVFHKKQSSHLYLVALYGTFIELAGSLTTLIECNQRTGVPTIYRSILEAYVELKNLHENSEYAYHMDASYYYQWSEVLKKAKDKPNPYLKSISVIENLDENLQKSEQELTELKKKGYNPLNMLKRFEQAGMIDEYYSIYNFLSCDAHSNIRALVSQHLEIHENDFTVVYYKDKPLDDFLKYLNPVAGFLTDASMRIHGFFKTGCIGEIERLRQELNEIRSHYVSV